MRKQSLSEQGVFLITGGIDRSSPAETSGLLPGDLIYQFGPISKGTFMSVKESIGPYCHANVGKTISVIVSRKNVDGVEEKITLAVEPRHWGGYGVLGCHFYSLQQKEGAFVKVKDVLHGSPAERCGMLTKDRIIEFGTVNAETYVDLEKSFGPLLVSNKDNAISILVTRVVDGVEEYVQLQLVPQVWGGPGLIGCALKTITPHSPLTRMARRLSGKISGRMPSFGIVKKLSTEGEVLSSGDTETPSPTKSRSPRGRSSVPCVSSPTNLSSPSHRASMKVTSPSSAPYTSPTPGSAATLSSTAVYGKGDWGTIMSDEEDDGPSAHF